MITPMSSQLGDQGARTSTPAAKGYLHQLDFVRTITFLGVIFMHTLTNTNDEVNGTVTNALALNLHFTRNTFFALTGLVLAYQALRKIDDFAAVPFWRRRVPLVVIPFVVWAFAYWVWGKAVNGETGLIPERLGEFFDHLKWGGTDGYQLYFIFVSIQIYLLFPLLFAIAKRMRGRHLQLLAASAALQLGVYALLTHYQPTEGFWAEYLPHAYATLLPYQFFVMTGIVAAFHRERIETILLRHWPLVFGGTAALVLAGQVLYQLRMHFGDAPYQASSVFQPTSMPIYLALIVSVYTIALLLARHHRSVPRLTRFAAYGTRHSFGIFLVHVMVLSTLLLPKSGSLPYLSSLPSPLGTVIAFVLTVAITLVLVELLSRAPKAHWWVGRPRVTRSRPTSASGKSAVGKSVLGKSVLGRSAAGKSVSERT